MSKMLDQLYEKKIKLETERPFGWKILLRVIDKQIDMYEKVEQRENS